MRPKRPSCPNRETWAQYVSCEVIATNSEGSSRSVERKRPPDRAQDGQELEVLCAPVVKKGPAAHRRPDPRALEKQLTAALKGARRSGLLKHGSYSFSFEPLLGGKLEFLWYQTPKASKTSAKPKPVLLARVRTHASGSSSKHTQKLRLTLAGRRALEHSKHPKLTVEGVFIPAGGTAVTWSKTVVLSG